MATIKDVKYYWNEHPLLSYELNSLGTSDFFEKLDEIKRTESDRFAIRYWSFNEFAGKKVLDVGCGPGWCAVNYAMGGAITYAIDLTPNAVELAKKHFAYRGVSGLIEEGNAESLIFENDFFDAVISSGVLHHTPDTEKAFKECFRVLKPGGIAKITLYRKGILHSDLLFWFTKLVMRYLRVKHPGADMARNAKDVDNFIRQYDGELNPVGIGKTHKEWTKMLQHAGFSIQGYEIHFFPKRFIPFNDNTLPGFIHYLLDRFLGTMIYFNLKK